MGRGGSEIGTHWEPGRPTASVGLSSLSFSESVCLSPGWVYCGTGLQGLSCFSVSFFLVPAWLSWVIKWEGGIPLPPGTVLGTERGTMCTKQD
jgi:hypothetical protein